MYEGLLKIQNIELKKVNKKDDENQMDNKKWKIRV